MEEGCVNRKSVDRTFNYKTAAMFKWPIMGPCWVYQPFWLMYKTIIYLVVLIFFNNNSSWILFSLYTYRYPIGPIVVAIWDRCNRCKCPLCPLASLPPQCCKLGHNGHGIYLYGVLISLWHAGGHSDRGLLLNLFFLWRQIIYQSINQYVADYKL